MTSSGQPAPSRCPKRATILPPLAPHRSMTCNSNSNYHTYYPSMGYRVRESAQYIQPPAYSQAHSDTQRPCEAAICHRQPGNSPKHHQTAPLETIHSTPRLLHCLFSDQFILKIWCFCSLSVNHHFAYVYTGLYMFYLPLFVYIETSLFETQIAI